MIESFDCSLASRIYVSYWKTTGYKRKDSTALATAPKGA